MSQSEKVDNSDLPTCIIVLGMASSGKSSFVKTFSSHLKSNNTSFCVVNLDPAIPNSQYDIDIDIRSSINYKDTMNKYSLGPNGAIVTCLNLFAVKFDQVMDDIQKREPKPKYVLFDTPGQIEVFTWSASGNIITQLLSSCYPTVIIYLVDTVRCQNPTSFMSNMLYASSIMAKYMLPFLLVFNKTDLKDCGEQIEWINDFEKYLDEADKDSSYMASFNRSMCLTISSFYEEIMTSNLSCKTGHGIELLMNHLNVCKDEYYKTYKNLLPNELCEKFNLSKSADKLQLDDVSRKLLNTEISDNLKKN